MLLASSVAHLFNCYSAIGQELCYCLDYGMIPVFGLTVTISYQHYLCSFKCFGFDYGNLGKFFRKAVKTFIVSFMLQVSIFGRYRFMAKYLLYFH